MGKDEESNIVSLDYYRRGKSASDEMTRHELTQLRDLFKETIYGDHYSTGLGDYQDLDKDLSKVSLKFKIALQEFDDYIRKNFKG